MDVGEPEEAHRGQPLARVENVEPPAHVLELYRLSVEMADRVSARRATANSFFLTLQTGLAAGLGLFATRIGDRGEAADPDRFVMVLAALAGVLLALAWWLLLRSYRDLNRAKFSVITMIEREYFQVQPFADEWASLRKDPVRWFRGRYTELGFVERAVPIAFVALYLILAAYVALR
jgi:hypothetical protein